MCGSSCLQCARSTAVSVTMPLVRHRLFHKQSVPRRRVAGKQPPSLWRDGPIRAYKAETRLHIPPEHMQNSIGRLCLVVQNGIPSRPERKKRPLCGRPTHPLAVASRPLPCNVGDFGIPCSNKKGTIFSHRETCPQFGPAGNQHCIPWGCGGAARRGWRGRFFFRSGRTQLRWCCIAMMVCVCVQWYF